LVYISAAESIGVGSSTNYTYNLPPKATEIGEITLCLGLLRGSRSFKVNKFGTNRKLICDFLLVINTNSYLAPFPRYSLPYVQSRYIRLNYPDRGVLLGRSPQTFTWISADGKRTKGHSNIAKNFNRLSRAHERYRQTTGGRTMTYSEREHEWVHVR